MKENSAKCDGLRVLLRAPYPPPYGGIASLIVSLLPGLKGYRADDVVVLHFGTTNTVEKIDGATVYRYALKSQVWRILLPQNWASFFLVLDTFKDARLGIKQLIMEATKTILVDEIAKRHSSNLVSFYQSNVNLELLVCKKMWKSTRGIVLTIFGEIYDDPDFMRSRPELFRHLIECPDVVLSSSAYCARSLNSIGVDRVIDVIFIGVDIRRFTDDGSLRASYRENLKITEDTTLLLFMGRFNPEMGLDNLIKSIPSLVQEHNQIKIILAGAKGPLCDMALECEKNHPNIVTVLNDVPFSTQPALYAASDIILAPSRDQHACMGVTIKEAMASSRPVIGTNSGGISEAIVHNETGMIIPLREDGHLDSGVFIEAIHSLVGDHQRCVEMGRKARIRAKELFSEETTVERYAEVFMRCLPND
jgi:glycosyltransferase involved in cell wall biosynthesis